MGVNINPPKKLKVSIGSTAPAVSTSTSTSTGSPTATVAAQSDSTATDVATLRADFNALLAKLRTSTIMQTGGASQQQVLNTLSLNASTVNEGAAADTLVATVVGTLTGSTVTLSANAGGCFKIVQASTNVWRVYTTATPTNYDVASSLQITIQESLNGISKSTTLTITVINVNDAATLGTLSFSSTNWAIGTPASGTIIGATAGSTISATGLPAGLIIDSTNRTWSWSGSGSAATADATLTEHLAGSPNDGHQSVCPYAVTAAGSVTYNTSIGNGVDGNGFALLSARSGAKTFYVRPSTGNDSNAGTNPTLPLATIDKALTLFTAGVGDRILIAEGEQLNESLPQGGDPHSWLASFSGYSAQYPSVFASYDPADPTNDAKIGMAHQRSAGRPKLKRKYTNNSGNGNYGFIAIKGLDFDAGNVGDQLGLGFVGQGHDILFENNIFRYCGISMDAGQPAPQGTRGSNVIVRGNALYGMWSSTTDGHTGGLYISGYDGVTVEDNAFWHCGWNVLIQRDESNPALGVPTVFNHSYYLQTTCTGCVVRRNFSADGAGDGGICRGDVVEFTENLFIDNPSAMGLGGGPDYLNDRQGSGLNPEVQINSSYNAILGADFVTSQHQLGWFISTSNGRPDARVHHNLAVRNYTTLDSVSGFSNGVSFGVNSFMQYDHNLMYLWMDPNYVNQPHGYYPDTSPLSYQAMDYNALDSATPEGTNYTVNPATMPNPMTKAQFYVANGFADKNAYIQYIINHPESRIWRVGRQMLMDGYGVTKQTDFTAPLLSTPTAALTGTTLTLGATTNKVGGRYYAILSTSNVAPTNWLVRHGCLASEAAAPKSGSSTAVTATGAKTFTIDVAGMASGNYYAHIIHEDTEVNKSVPVTTAVIAIGAQASGFDAANSDTVAIDISSDNLTMTRSRALPVDGDGNVLWAFGRVGPKLLTGSIVFTINAIGAHTPYIGFTIDNNNSGNLGGNTRSIGFDTGSGGLLYNGDTVHNLGIWAVGDKGKIDKDSTGNVYTFSKWNTGTSAWDQLFVLDTANPTYAGGATPIGGVAWPAFGDRGGTGLSITVDVTNWHSS